MKIENDKSRQSIKRNGGNINNIEINQENIEQMEISFNIKMYKVGRYTYVLSKDMLSIPNLS